MYFKYDLLRERMGVSIVTHTVWVSRTHMISWVRDTWARTIRYHICESNSDDIVSSWRTHHMISWVRDTLYMCLELIWYHEFVTHGPLELGAIFELFIRTYRCTYIFIHIYIYIYVLTTTLLEPGGTFGMFIYTYIYTVIFINIYIYIYWYIHTCTNSYCLIATSKREVGGSLAYSCIRTF